MPVTKYIYFVPFTLIQYFKNAKDNLTDTYRLEST